MDIWFSRPGIASALIPRDGIVHEWMTSKEVEISRRGSLVGIMRLVEGVKRRKVLLGSKV